MTNIWIICRKELKSYFASPIAYLVITCFALIWGYVFYMSTAEFVRYGFMAEMQGRSAPMNVNEMVIRPLLQFGATVALFLIPLITMRIFAEEKKTGTIELLLTSPVEDWEIILGKWFGALFLYLCVLAVSALNIALLFAFGKPDWKPILIGYLGLILQGGTLLAIGTFISNLTKNQIVAGVATFFACLLLWLLSWSTAFQATGFAQVIGYLSIVTHFDGFAKGVIDSKDVIFYLSMIFFSLFLTARSMESLRWRA
jgi:ABC-2 type transport system permease protein